MFGFLKNLARLKSKRSSAADRRRLNKLREIAQDLGAEVLAEDVVTCTYRVNAHIEPGQSIANAHEIDGANATAAPVSC